MRQGAGGILDGLAFQSLRDDVVDGSPVGRDPQEQGRQRRRDQPVDRPTVAMKAKQTKSAR